MCPPLHPALGRGVRPILARWRAMETWEGADTGPPGPGVCWGESPAPGAGGCFPRPFLRRSRCVHTRGFEGKQDLLLRLFWGLQPSLWPSAKPLASPAWTGGGANESVQN